MTSLAAQLGVTMESDPLRDAFLGWQCRARQMMMREGEGKPTDAITPAVTLPGEDEPMLGRGAAPSDPAQGTSVESCSGPWSTQADPRPRSCGTQTVTVPEQLLPAASVAV